MTLLRGRRRDVAEYLDGSVGGGELEIDCSGAEGGGLQTSKKNMRSKRGG